MPLPLRGLLDTAQGTVEGLLGRWGVPSAVFVQTRARHGGGAERTSNFPVGTCNGSAAPKNRGPSSRGLRATRRPCTHSTAPFFWGGGGRLPHRPGSTAPFTPFAASLFGIVAGHEPTPTLLSQLEVTQGRCSRLFPVWAWGCAPPPNGDTRDDSSAQCLRGRGAAFCPPSPSIWPGARVRELPRKRGRAGGEQ
jgi:hypothetical protein